MSASCEDRFSGDLHRVGDVRILIMLIQISSILWSTDYKQIVTGQGHPNNYIHIWHYPTMDKCHTLHGSETHLSLLIVVFSLSLCFRAYITHSLVDYGSKRQSSCQSLSGWNDPILELLSSWCSTKEENRNDANTLLSYPTEFQLSMNEYFLFSSLFLSFLFFLLSCSIDSAQDWWKQSLVLMLDKTFSLYWVTAERGKGIVCCSSWLTAEALGEA